MRHLIVLGPLLLVACNPEVPFDPSLCPPPTGEQCANWEATGGCDRYFIDQAKTDPEAACSLLYQQGFADETARWPTKTVLTTTLYRGAQKFPPDAGEKDVAQIPNTTSFSPKGLDSMLLGEAMSTANGLRVQSTLFAALLRAKLVETRKKWRDNGNSVASCHEFVHEKFYDYTTYLDRVFLSSGYTDPRIAFDIAYTVDTLNNPEFALGTNHLTDPTIRSRNSADSGAVVTFPKDQPKNDFFLVPAPADSKIFFVKAPPGSEDQVIAPNIAGSPVTIRLKNLQRAALNFAGVELESAPLRQLITAGRALKHDESFEWHRQMAARNASVLDERLYQFEAKKAEFRKLLERREQVQDALATALNDRDKVPSATINKFATKWYLDPLWNPPPGDVTAAAQRGVNVLSGLNVHPGNALAAPITTFSNNPQQPGPQPVSQTLSVPQVQAACAIATGQDGTSFNKLICLSYQLAALDLLIEEELKKAQADGCLSIGGANVAAPCDWSPQRFAQAVLGRFQEEREAAYELCTASVENDSFSLLENRPFRYPSDGSGIDIPAKNYTVDTTAVEQFFTNQDAYLTVVAKDVGPLLQRTGDNKLRLWRSLGDEFGMGNDFFGAGMNYQAGFAMEDVATQADACDIRTSTWGKFGVTLRAIGAEIELIKADVLATVGGNSAPGNPLNKNRFDAGLRVLGYAWGVHEPIPEAQTAMYSKSEIEVKDFLDEFGILQISYITIRIGAAVGGGMGYGFDFAAGKHTVMGNPCTVTRVGVSGQITPFAFIQGTAYAVIEAVVARAGIKGYLTLVYVATPFGGELSLGENVNDPAVIDATFRLGAKLLLEFFSGRIVAYIEVGFPPLAWSAEAEIVSWRGLTFEIPLFDFDLRLVLGDLRRILNQQGEVPGMKPPPPETPPAMPGSP